MGTITIQYDPAMLRVASRGKPYEEPVKITLTNADKEGTMLYEVAVVENDEVLYREAFTAPNDIVAAFRAGKRFNDEGSAIKSYKDIEVIVRPFQGSR